MDAVPIFLCFGWVKNAREGYVVKIEIDGEEVGASSPIEFEFVSNPAKRQRMCWWAGTVDLIPGTQVHLTTAVGARGLGRDTDRSTDQLFVVDPENNVRDISVAKVGFEKYPLLRGRLRYISAESNQDKTARAIEGMLEKVEES